MSPSESGVTMNPSITFHWTLSTRQQKDEHKHQRNDTNYHFDVNDNELYVAFTHCDVESQREVKECSMQVHCVLRSINKHKHDYLLN